jgi:predicted phage terminase large subunit-like protein
MATVKDVLQKATPNQLKAAILKQSFELFVKSAWPIVCSEQLAWELPQQVTSLHLQSIQDGKFPDNHTLTISVPPGQSKSLLTSVLYPAWVWARNPSHSFICATHTSALTQRFATRFRELIESDWYRGLFAVKFTDDTNNKLAMRNVSGGERLGVSVGGSITGSHADTHICDDLVDASDSSNQKALVAANHWYDLVLSTRAKNANKLSSIVIAQRLACADIVGHLESRSTTIKLSLPAVLDGAPCKTPVWTDPRQPGELLAPLRLPQVVLDVRSAALGMYGFSAQYQQAPVPTGGGMLRREWFTARHSAYNTQGCEATPAKFEKIALVIDAAFKGGPQNDKVAMLVCGVLKARLYVLDMAWDNMDFMATVATIKRLVTKWKVTEIAIEDKANGPAIINQLRSQMGYGTPIIPIKAEDSKEARISAASPNIEGGCVVLPMTFQSTSKTVDEFLQEVCAFPFAPNDDATDALAHAVMRYATKDDFWAAVEADRSVWR